MQVYNILGACSRKPCHLSVFCITPPDSDFYVMPSVLIGFYSLLLNIGPTYERKRDFCLSEIDVIALI